MGKKYFYLSSKIPFQRAQKLLFKSYHFPRTTAHQSFAVKRTSCTLNWRPLRFSIVAPINWAWMYSKVLVPRIIYLRPKISFTSTGGATRDAINSLTSVRPLTLFVSDNPITEQGHLSYPLINPNTTATPVGDKTSYSGTCTVRRYIMTGTAINIGFIRVAVLGARGYVCAEPSPLWNITIVVLRL